MAENVFLVVVIASMSVTEILSFSLLRSKDIIKNGITNWCFFITLVYSSGYMIIKVSGHNGLKSK